jgi:hypothetical protein
VPKIIDFGHVFTISPAKYELKLRNPTRRNVHLKLFVDREYNDIFVVEGDSSKVTLRAKSISSVFINFKPKISVTYNSQAFVETDLGSSTISLTGTGVEAILKATCETYDFGSVGEVLQEFRKIALQNPTPLAMPIRLRSDNETFTFEPCECTVQAGEERTVQIIFLPVVKQKLEKCVAQISMLELEDDGADYDMTEYSLKNEIEPLQTFEFQGTGGTFGLVANGKMVSVDMFGKPTVVEMSFPKVNVRSKIQRSFVVENTGDVPLVYQIVDKHGAILGDVPVLSDKGVLSCTIKTGSLRVAPRSKETIFVTIEVFSSLSLGYQLGN